MEILGGLLQQGKEFSQSMKVPIVLLVVFMMLPGCMEGVRKQTNQTWQLVYQNDFNGRPISGSIKELTDAMKRGSPIRVSWGGTESDGSSWIEFAEPIFTTIMNDTAVVVQFPLSFIQSNYTDPDSAFLKTDPPTGWRAIMSTTGDYHQFHYNLKNGEVSRIMYARTNMGWFALSKREDDRPVPNLTPENAFKLDSLLTPDKDNK